MASFVLWTLAAAVLGLCVTSVFVSMLHWRRAAFLVPYVFLVMLFLYVYARWARLDVGALLSKNLLWGVVAAIVVGFVLIRNVLGQPAAPRSQGPRLLFELFWFGLVYGAIDGLFLSVFPVLLAWQSFPDLRTTPLGVVGVGLLALVSSAVVTVGYHAGYPEFRNSSMRMAVFGNAIISLAYLISLNPISAFASHAAMHIVAVWRGSEGTIQLPPHYSEATDPAVA
jgi:hypothetical protein